MTEDAIKRVLYAPDGTPITSILVWCVSGVRVERIDERGNAEQSHFDDFPTFEDYLPSQQVLIDRDGGNWLWGHCRMVLADADYEPEDRSIDSWDQPIVDACARLLSLTEGKHTLDRARRALPSGFDDAIVGTMLDKVVVTRIDTEIAELEQQVSAYRKTRTEIEHVNELPCETCEGRGGALLPCDECGACAVIEDEESEDA